MVTTSENRSSDRRSVSWRARILLPGGQVLDARATDASANGLGLLCAKPLLHDSHIQLAVQVPAVGASGKFNVVTGKARVAFQVLRGDEYQVGVEWVQIEPAMSQLITQCLEKIAMPQRN